MSKLIGYSWQVAAAALLLGGVILSKGGLASLMTLGRFVAPIVIAYFIYRLVRAKLEKSLGGAMRSKLQGIMEAAMQQQTAAAGGARRGGAAGRDKVIDLCPQCGSYLAPGHRCKKG